MDAIRFDAPEFYSQDSIVLTVNGPHGDYTIFSEGDRDAIYTVTHSDGEASVTNTLHLTTSDDFRELFPDGNLPEMSDNFVWRYNAWFAIYKDGEVVGEPDFSLTEAIAYALMLAYP